MSILVFAFYGDLLFFTLLFALSFFTLIVLHHMFVGPHPSSTSILSIPLSTHYFLERPELCITLQQQPQESVSTASLDMSIFHVHKARQLSFSLSFPLCFFPSLSLFLSPALSIVLIIHSALYIGLHRNSFTTFDSISICLSTSLHSTSLVRFSWILHPLHSGE